MHVLFPNAFGAEAILFDLNDLSRLKSTWLGQVESSRVKVKLKSTYRVAATLVKLELVKPDSFVGQPRNDEPPPVLDVPGNVQWVVEEIFEAKYRYNKLWYFVKRKGYGDKDNKWVEHSDLFADEAVADYYSWRTPPPL
ncbi:hypothetical protein B0H13DRAFT_2305166 [Mycena leptocephala]|nr:hypothetical protein B0H13DRAFT_2305166 [Mycena leptocephala]